MVLETSELYSRHHSQLQNVFIAQRRNSIPFCSSPTTTHSSALSVEEYVFQFPDIYQLWTLRMNETI